MALQAGEFGGGFYLSRLYQQQIRFCEAVLNFRIVPEFGLMFVTTGNGLAPYYLTNKRPLITEKIEVWVLVI